MEKEESGTIEVDQLRTWLESGREIAVVDIRPASDYQNWHIPASINVDAYQAIQHKNPGALVSYQPSSGTPVVVVCFTGRTSLAAAQYLRSRGIPAVSLNGGMNGWSLAWNTAEIPLPGCAGQVIQVRRTGKGCLSYLIGSDREALVIDPSVEPRVYLDLAEKKGWQIHRVIDTHIHADHLSRSRELAQMTGAVYLLPRQDRVQFEYHPIRNGDQFQVGRAKMRAMSTPGHTMESMCFLLDEKALFTGDTLFIDSVGRLDLKANPKETQSRAYSLFKTLQELRVLQSEILVLPGHTGKPIAFDGIPIAGGLRTIIDRNPAFGYGEEEFIVWAIGRISLPPAHYEEIVQYNEAGQMPDFNPIQLEAGPNHCAV